MSKKRDKGTKGRSDEGKSAPDAVPLARIPLSLCPFVALSLVVSLSVILLSGCDYGVGGTGEFVVPRETLHDFDHMKLTPAPATQATTEPTTMPTTAPAESVELTIEQVRRDALKNNLDLQVQLFNPTIASEGLRAERAKFEAVFTTDANYSKSESPTITPKIAGTESKSMSITPGLRLPLQIGGEIDLNGPQSQDETNNPAAAASRFYTSAADASISLPLLRGFGVAANAQSIRIAFYSSQSAQAATKLEVIQVLTDAEKTYWLLYAARRELEVRKKEYDLAIAQLDRARRQVAAGALAEVEIVRAESGVADTVQSIITAENVVRQQQRNLKRIMHRDDLPLDAPTIIIPATAPEPTPYALDPQRLARQSLHERMELLQTELQIASDYANIDAAKNALLPVLSLQYRYGLNGLGSEYSRAFSEVADKRFETNTAGLHLEIPIGNEAARAHLRSALLARLHSLATKQQQTVQITQEVYDAVDTLNAAWESILAAQKRTILNARLLEVEIRSFNQGLRTSTEVLDAQTKLADAQSAEIGAITAYQIAQVDLAFATGTVLGESRIDWAPMPSPKD